MGACSCCAGALRDSVRGIAVLTALGGLASLLLGVHSLLPLGASALDPSVSWFGLTLGTIGAILVVLGMTAGVGVAASLHCFTGASLVLLPLSTLAVWAYAAHPTQLRWLADRDQTYALTTILDWVDGNVQLAAGLAGLWLLLQAAAVALGSLYACCPGGGRRQKHPWDHYWSAEEDGRAPLLPRGRTGSDPSGSSASPRATGYHTPPSRFQSPYMSPARALPTGGPLVTGIPPQPTVTVTVGNH